MRQDNIIQKLSQCILCVMLLATCSTLSLVQMCTHAYTLHYICICCVFIHLFHILWLWGMSYEQWASILLLLMFEYNMNIYPYHIVHAIAICIRVASKWFNCYFDLLLLHFVHLLLINSLFSSNIAEICRTIKTKTQMKSRRRKKKISHLMHIDFNHPPFFVCYLFSIESANIEPVNWIWNYWWYYYDIVDDYDVLAFHLSKKNESL